ncbi:hypothetical protein FBUS_01938 [Fasciolopsis buskii]|uniref:Uncharacterized protein n=1 Tax=Fasciolopsis buskii TaxID=27845 RepID=A0A8E0VH91_9TREM|nr:hypothetical protein FBUS_01938 [Fasciolopsis buski]
MTIYLKSIYWHIYLFFFSAIVYTYEVKVQMNSGDTPMEWVSDLENPNSDTYKAHSRSLCNFFLKSANYSTQLQNKNVTCRVLRFLRGSAYGVVELEVETTGENKMDSTDIRTALVEGATTYVNSEPTGMSEVTFNSVAAITHVGTQIITAKPTNSTTASTSVSSTTSAEPSTSTMVSLPPASFSTVYRLYRITVSLETGGKPMKWDTRLEDTQSDYYKKMSTSACEFLLNVTMYSGSQGLQSVSCYFYAFGPGSVKAIMDAVAKTSPSVAPTETQITQNLIDGIQNYVHFNGGLDSNPFYFSLSDPIQVSDSLFIPLSGNRSRALYFCFCSFHPSHAVSDGAIVLVVVSVLVLTAVINFLIVASVYLNRYRYA